MLAWSRLLLGLCLVTGGLGFTGRAGSASGVACDLCGILTVLLAASLLAAAGRIRPPF